MEEIDKPFRPTKSFMVVWALLIAVVLIYHKALIDTTLPWYSTVSFIVLVPFIATFLVWGPVMLLCQVRSSGPRGRFVFRMWLLTVAILAGVAVFLYSTKNYTLFASFSGFYGVLLLYSLIGRPQPDPPKEPGFLRRD